MSADIFEIEAGLAEADRGEFASAAEVAEVVAKYVGGGRGSQSSGLGLDAFRKISVVEGMRLSPESERMFAEFDRQGLNDEERRRTIIEKHRPKA